MSEEMKNLNNEPEQAPVDNQPAAKKPLDKKTLGITRCLYLDSTTLWQVGR